MAYAVISPQAALVRTFGESLQGPVADVVVRNWGALITLIGVMLVYGAFNPANRRLVLAVAGMSKVVFIFLILVYGTQYLPRAGIAVAVDSVMVFLFALYLMSTRGRSSSA